MSRTRRISKLVEAVDLGKGLDEFRDPERDRKRKEEQERLNRKRQQEEEEYEKSLQGIDQFQTPTFNPEDTKSLWNGRRIQEEVEKLHAKHGVKPLYADERHGLETRYYDFEDPAVLRKFETELGVLVDRTGGILKTEKRPGWDLVLHYDNDIAATSEDEYDPEGVRTV